MKYDLEIRWGKRRQAFYLTVTHANTNFHYVIAPADSYIKTTHFLGGYSIYSVLLGAKYRYGTVLGVRRGVKCRNVLVKSVRLPANTFFNLPLRDHLSKLSRHYGRSKWRPFLRLTKLSLSALIQIGHH
jgi:hypothetical protein